MRVTKEDAPGPSRLWVLVDEDVHSINDAAFCFGMEQPEWIDAPGAAHNGACGFAFADGHSEIHRWLGRPSYHGAITDPPGHQD